MSLDCLTCGSVDNKEETVKSVVFQDVALGEVCISGILQWSCVNCGETLLLSGQSSLAVETYIKNLKNTIIGKLPVKDFIAKAHALKLSGIGLDAVSIRNFDRFVHRIKIAGRWMYWRPSVEAFQISGDGRIPLR